MWIRVEDSNPCFWPSLRPLVKGETISICDDAARSFIGAGIATEVPEPPGTREKFLSRLDYGAGETCVFLPFLGEFGHLIGHYVRLVHFHRAKRKIVCCRRGQEVLFPTADAFEYDWVSPIHDSAKCGMGNHATWPFLAKHYEDCRLIPSGDVGWDEEFFGIHLDRAIQFKPKTMGFRADVCIGTRNRQFTPEKNWRGWHHVGERLSHERLSFAVIGQVPTSYSLMNQVCMSGKHGNLDLAIELLQGCELFAGTDSGAAHLAAACGAPMLVVRNPLRWRDHTGQMAKVNPDLEVIDGWDNPKMVGDRILAILKHPKQS